MSPDLRDEILLELAQLQRLFGEYRHLLERTKNTPPNHVEIMALAGVLHSFYTGVENLCKRIAIHSEIPLPSGESWHRSLLDTMTRPQGSNPPVFSPSLHQELVSYLKFRHRYRQAYSFQLEWDKMSHLAQQASTVFTRVERELRAFLAAFPS